MINGLASEQNRNLMENTWTTDASYEINDYHTLKGSVYLTSQIESAASATTAFRTDSSGNVLSDLPITIENGQNKDGYLYGLYLEDQWRPIDRLTINYGLRFDHVDEFVTENQVSPRVNIVYQAALETALFAGYSRFFVPAQLEYLPPSSVQKYVNTTAASSVTTDDQPRAERSHYFGAGITHQVNKDWKLGWKATTNCKETLPMKLKLVILKSTSLLATRAATMLAGN
jgi:outer membrane receptor protein involved in Fe transport